MEVLRRNTDYAIRAVVDLAGHFEKEAVSTSQIAEQDGIPYQLACKLMQKLAKAGLVKSCMGTNGGFRLNKKPGKISLFDVIGAVQGPVLVNKCSHHDYKCEQRGKCPAYNKIMELQGSIESYLKGVTINELLQSEVKKTRTK